MPKLINRPPRLCLEKRRNQAVVRIGGKEIYLGTWGSEESRRDKFTPMNNTELE